MSDNDIIKALKCCTTVGEGGCGSWYFNINSAMCVTNLMKAALVLVTRQNAEIGRLKEDIKNIQDANLLAFKSSVKISKADAASNAIKEFAARLKCKALKTKIFPFDRCITIEDINNLVKEMTGERG